VNIMPALAAFKSWRNASKKVWSKCVSHEHSLSTTYMPMALSSSTCIASSEGPERTVIDLEQA